jgi:hypothetical protein
VIEAFAARIKTERPDAWAELADPEKASAFIAFCHDSGHLITMPQPIARDTPRNVAVVAVARATLTTIQILVQHEGARH